MSARNQDQRDVGTRACDRFGLLAAEYCRRYAGQVELEERRGEERREEKRRGRGARNILYGFRYHISEGGRVRRVGPLTIPDASERGCYQLAVAEQR